MPAPKKTATKIAVEKKPSTVVSKVVHEAETSELKSQVKAAKSETTKEKLKADAAAKAAEQERQKAEAARIEAQKKDIEIDRLAIELDNLRTKAKNTVDDVADFGEKVNTQTSRKWVGVALLFLLIVAGVYIAFLLHSENKKDATITSLQTENAELKNRLSVQAQGKPYDSAYNANKNIPKPDPEADSKNFNGAGK